MERLNPPQLHKLSIVYVCHLSLIHSNFMPLQYVGGECALRYGLKREVKDKPIADGVDVALLLMQLWSPSDTLLNTRMVRFH